MGLSDRFMPKHMLSRQRYIVLLVHTKNGSVCCILYNSLYYYPQASAAIFRLEIAMYHRLLCACIRDANRSKQEYCSEKTICIDESIIVIACNTTMGLFWTPTVRALDGLHALSTTHGHTCTKVVVDARGGWIGGTVVLRASRHQ